MNFPNPSFLYGISSSWWDDINALDLNLGNDHDDFNHFLDNMHIPEIGPMGVELPPPASLDPSARDNVASLVGEKIVPHATDILLGRGRAKQVYLGNLWFREQVALRSDEYRRSGKSGKTELSKEIVVLAAQRGSRFLKSTTVNGETVWQELSRKAAREKVAYTFRYIIQQMQD